MTSFGESPWFAVILLVIAALYAAVGQAGATGYLAAMGVVGLETTVMKPTALALNLAVASIATIQFWRAGLFSWSTFYPFAVLGFRYRWWEAPFIFPGTSTTPWSAQSCFSRRCSCCARRSERVQRRRQSRPSCLHSYPRF